MRIQNISINLEIYSNHSIKRKCCVVLSFVKKIALLALTSYEIKQKEYMGFAFNWYFSTSKASDASEVECISAEIDKNVRVWGLACPKQQPWF